MNDTVLECDQIVVVLEGDKSASDPFIFLSEERNYLAFQTVF